MTNQSKNILENCQVILTETQSILARQKELQKQNGENFNIFSILKMESKENATHSAFLGELLNPKGSHLLGTVFLNHFLELIGAKDKLNSATARLVLEKHVGSRDDVNKIGGRIDIYLSDTDGKSISIENKIYAGDQYTQIERYVNHNKDNNTVYYLTLNGEDASEGSRGELKSNEDYHCISFKSTIIAWLEKCVREASAQPILSTTIQQYIILIKKLTHQLSNHTMAKEVEALIRENYEEAKVIEENVWKVELHAAKRFLDEVKSAIELELKEYWTVEVSEDLNSSWTGIYISHSAWNGVIVKLEGSSKVPWSNSIYGIQAHNKTIDRVSITDNCAKLNVFKDGFKESDYWPYYQTILWLAKDENRIKLFDDNERKHLVEVVGDKLIALAKACEKQLSKATLVLKP
ncbi:MAG: PD-(D/E)XK nuclease family protein [Fluviicola sp.]|nr:PD-(D/E)XK nuclease family protein [Fluviicola sp.]